MTHPTHPTGPRRRLRRGAALLAGLAALLLALPRPAGAEDRAARARFDAAGEAFAAQRYDEAERRLEELIASEGFAPGALLNLGNAHLEQGELGRAILAYERARLLDPQDPAIERNLRHARERASVRAPATTTAERAALAWPARRWLTAGVVGLSLFVLACLAFGLLRRGRWIASGLGLASGALTAACAAALWIGTFGVDRAVVLEGSSTARISPFAEAEPVFDAAEGETVEALEAHEGFLRVRRADGSEGWLPDRSVERVVPRGAG